MAQVAYSIGKASRNDGTVSKSQRQNPGPGAYAPAGGNRYKESPQYGVGTSKRSDVTASGKKFVPAPGQYTIKSSVGQGPAYFMGEKCDSGALGGAKFVPGPGAYSPTKVKDSASYSMGSKTKFGMSIAVQPETGTHTKIAASNDWTPGPGTYYAKSVYKNVNGGTRFGTDSRKGMGDSKAKFTPGPNAYRADNKTTVLRAAPKFGFGTSRRPQSVNIKQQRPGPGTYELKGITGRESQGKSIAARLNQSKTTSAFNPGPGQYTPAYTQAIKSNPGWKIGTAVRGEEERNIRRRNYPPPDSYDPKMEASKTKMASWSFGSSVRADFGKGNKNPGPNNYSMSEKKTGPAYGMGLKLENQSLIGSNVKKTAGNPGAGNYHPDFNPTKKAMPAFSMKGRHKNAKNARVPGPGAYSSTGSPDKKAAPSYGFGTAAQRGKLATSVAPGPGVYQIPCSIGHLPGYTGARSNMAYV